MKSQPRSFSILMVCMGNICRSPTAEGVLRHMLKQTELADLVRIDSAGTLDYHAGSPPDARSQQHAARRGYDLSSLRARQVRMKDFEEFDLILAMDYQNLGELEDACPPQHKHKLRRLMEFAPPGINDIVPDPYTGGSRMFEGVLDHIEAACRGLVADLRRRLAQAR